MPYLIFPLPTANSSAIGNYGWPIKQTPMFNTITQPSVSGRGELRIPTMTYPRWDFVLDVTYLPGDGTGDNSDWQTLMNFLMGVQGASSTWSFLHPYQNTADGQLIGVGDGTTTTFPMTWSLFPGGALELIQNFVSSPSIYVNGVLQTVSTDYTIDQWGNCNFVTAPTSGYGVVWSGQFYYLCHFLEDTWQEIQENWYQSWTIDQFKFRSVIL